MLNAAATTSWRSAAGKRGCKTMAKNYIMKLLNAPKTQGARSKGRTDEVRNYSGAYVFGVDDRTRMERFLVLGSEGGSYYATEQALTRENAEATLRYIAA